MIVIEIPPNPNCEAVELRVFHDLEPPRPIRQVRLERSPGAPAWHDVVGWTLAGVACPAQAQKVDDSGEGVAFLIYGGEAGLRLRPAGSQEPWSLECANQQGVSFLIVADPGDFR